MLKLVAGSLKELTLHRHNKYLVEIIENARLARARESHAHVVLITGPTGAGKDTLINALPGDKFVRWRTWTTRREIRADEKDSDPYVRVSHKEFEAEELKGNFIETNPYAENRYGTHRREAEAAFADGRIPVLRVDPRGALTFNKLFEAKVDPFHKASLHHFYIVPPSKNELFLRLQKREKDREAADKRYQIALADLVFAANAHYLLLNQTNKVKQVSEALTSHLRSFGLAV
ncbi:hypothetical protein A2803_01935 [Candidatus Woesebacteria bacterium RIFCSPHIGHO2_01_FULL_44_21]|uniref:Guanylate kinase-like domain-containing protein n=1 Tax=Candidatus Woesebacteria bacterium RIFCSPHIGHO2_01_FULL_44_21 TaxID=1802503 RepID=A0A1F7YV57_9BACT|nr:MAG: hypothetical protein A2803_01935 [Candidatus Woesebacteria bacterium RIFCSPHIGHO2_01_FULL_44_21]